MEDFKGHAMQCEDCGRRAEADEGAGWVAVHSGFSLPQLAQTNTYRV
jgi:hypothetical protein